MKKILIISCLLSLSFFACESNEDFLEQKQQQTDQQNKQQNLQELPNHKYARQFQLDVNYYFDAYNRQDWDQVIETTYPLVFRSKKKEDRIVPFIQSTSMGIKRNTAIKKIEKISKVLVVDNKLYSKIYLGADVTVTLTGKALEGKDFIKTNLELSYDTQDLLFDEKKGSYHIDAYIVMLAISEKDSNLWKYIEIDKQKEPLLSTIIPQKVLDQLD